MDLKDPRSTVPSKWPVDGRRSARRRLPQSQRASRVCAVARSSRVSASPRFAGACSSYRPASNRRRRVEQAEAPACRTSSVSGSPVAGGAWTSLRGRTVRLPRDCCGKPSDCSSKSSASLGHRSGVARMPVTLALSPGSLRGGGPSSGNAFHLVGDGGQLFRHARRLRGGCGRWSSDARGRRRRGCPGRARPGRTPDGRGPARLCYCSRHFDADYVVAVGASDSQPSGVSLAFGVGVFGAARAELLVASVRSVPSVIRFRFTDQASLPRRSVMEGRDISVTSVRDCARRWHSTAACEPVSSAGRQPIEQSVPWSWNVRVSVALNCTLGHGHVFG